MKDISKDSENEDRPKTTPMNDLITREKNHISNISEKMNDNNNNKTCKNNINNIKIKQSNIKESLSASNLKQPKKKKVEEEIIDINANRLRYIENINTIALIDAEKKSDQENQKNYKKCKLKYQDKQKME